MPVSEATFKRVALEDPDGKWELHGGRLRQKDGVTAAHNDIGRVLGFRLQSQLPLHAWRVCTDDGRVRRPGGSYVVPDVMVVPVSLVSAFKRLHPNELEVYEPPLPLVVEVWSPSTGHYDLETKVPDYQARGDQEIWRFHMRDRTLTVWVRQDDGSYREQVYRGGAVPVAALPAVVIDLDERIKLTVQIADPGPSAVAGSQETRRRE